MPGHSHPKSKRALLALLLVLLLLPAAQARFKFVRVAALDGYSPDAAGHPTLTWDGLTDNSYQTRLEQYLAARVGFREWFIRLRNQLAYTFLNIARTNHAVVGRRKVLYEAKPVHAYLGEDFVGAGLVAQRVRRFRAMQDTLARRGTLLVYVAAPSKASYLPEYLPAYYRRQQPQLTNYQAYTAAMRAAGINLLDLSQAFRQWKDTASYPLFPRGGTHWSGYGFKLAGDTLLRYLEQKYHQDLRDFHLTKGDVSDEPRDTDDDIAKALNLLWKPAAYRMAYPNVKFEPLKPGQRTPNLLLIGDSFCWSIIYPFIFETFDKQRTRFWYYGAEVAWPEERPEGHNVAALDIKQQCLSRDIIVVLYTEYNMNTLDGGLISDRLYRLLSPYTHADTVRMQALANKIRLTPGLADKWWKKSAATGLTLEQLSQQQAAAQYDSLR